MPRGYDADMGQALDSPQGHSDPVPAPRVVPAQHPVRPLAGKMSRLSEAGLAATSIEQLLANVVELAMEFRGCESATVVLGEAGYQTPGSYQFDDAAQDPSEALPDLATDWVGILCFDFAADSIPGRLICFSDDPVGFDEPTRADLAAYAEHVAVVLKVTRNRLQLRQAIATRGLIGQAIGIVMATRHLSSRQALAYLIDTSQRNNIKLREVARLMLDETDRTKAP